MRQQISSLLESGDEASTLLAFQLLKGGGVHPEHLTHLLALFTWQKHDWEAPLKVKSQAKLLFNKGATQDMKTFQFNNPLLTERMLKIRQLDTEKPFGRYLEEYAPKANVDIGILSFMALLLLGSYRGARYLFHHAVRNMHTVLELCIQDTTDLTLKDFDLDNLPTEIGDFPKLTYLNLTGNPLQDVPRSLKNLKNLSSIYVTLEILSEQALRKMILYLPRF